MKLSITALRRQLFASPLDGLITLLLLACSGWLLALLGHWVLALANWKVVASNLPLYLMGLYPAAAYWRPLVLMACLVLLAVLTLLSPQLPRLAVFRWLQRLLPWLWLLALPLGFWLLSGGLGLDPVRTRQWGGLTLTLVVTAGSALLALPLGVLLALGRRSPYPLVHHSSSFYVELIRAVPLISVLFFGQLLIPLFLPSGWTIDRVLRAVLSFAFFAAAYVAEDVRGGLQALPPTQREAAHALGLSMVQTVGLVLLPQALRIALPALTNQLVGLVQNTSLLAILGAVELLGISRSILANPQFIGRYLEVYVWLGVLYWLICTTMTLIARQLEARLGAGAGSPSSG